MKVLVLTIILLLSLGKSTQSQSVQCETFQEDVHVSMKTATTGILLTFSSSYAPGSYSLLEAVASITIVHNDMGFRYQPVLRIEYPTSTQVKLYIRSTVTRSNTTNMVEFDWEGTTGYEYNVSFVPLSYRGGSWITFDNTPLSAFTCLTIDRVAPSIHVPILAEFPGQNPIIVLMFSEPVNGTFTGQSFNPPLANASFTPYFPTPDGFSTVYTATTTTSPLPLNATDFYYPNAGVVTDKAGNANTFQRYQYSGTQLLANKPVFHVTANGTYRNLFRNQAHIGSNSLLPKLGKAGWTHDSDWDGRPDEIYFHGMAAFDDSLFSTSMIRVDDYITSISCTKVPDNGRYNNLLRMSCFFPSNLAADTNPYINHRVYMPLHVPFRLQTSFLVGTIYASPQIFIQKVIMQSRTLVLIILSRFHTTDLHHTNFFLVSPTMNNSLNSTLTPNTYSIYIRLANPIDRSCVQEYSTTPNLYFIEPMLYGNLHPLNYMSGPTSVGEGICTGAKVPPWRGKSPTLAEYGAPRFSSIIIYLNAEQTKWALIRIAFYESVYIHNDTLAITLVPQNNNLVRSIDVPLERGARVSKTTFEFPIIVDCYDPTNCNATDPTHLRIANLSGFEDELFNLFVSVTNPRFTVLPITI